MKLDFVKLEKQLEAAHKAVPNIEYYEFCKDVFKKAKNGDASSIDFCEELQAVMEMYGLWEDNNEDT